MESHDEREATEHGKSRTTERFYGDESRRFNGNHQKHTSGAFCPCGAWRGSLGLEPTIDLYVQHIVEIFREVRRVLREDGTLWLNMGDSYAGSQQGIGADGTAYAGPKQATNAGSVGIQAKPRKAHEIGLKPKDLCMMPARVALALQADGWWLRSDIIWSKPNPMPGSYKDRPTTAHEYVFLLTKAERYYYDADAIAEPTAASSLVRYDYPRVGANNKGHSGEYAIQSAEYTEAEKERGYRNKRSVWEIATEAFPGAHFATFPQKLVEPCILAGCPSDGTVLDPFCGSATTVYVAQRLGRRAIGIDLSAEYLALAEKRLLGQTLPMALT